MSSLIVRLSGPSGFNNNRPVRASRDVRVRAIDSSTSATTSGVPSQGGMPVIALPFLAAAAAGPMYGYTKSQQEIAVAREKYAAELAAKGGAKKA